MRERKKTGVHGTLKVVPLAWKFNSKQLLCKTLNSRMNIIETRAVLNIIKKSEIETKIGEKHLNFFRKWYFEKYLKHV